MVLLKNDGSPSTLPLSKSKKTVVIGPLGDSDHDMLGPWWGQGKDADAVTVFDGIKAQNPDTTFVQGCTIGHGEPPTNPPAEECGDDSGFAAAETAARGAQQVVLALGESREQSGEAASRSEIDLPGKQEELVRRIKATGTPFVVVLFNGRPLTLDSVVDDAPAILEAWFRRPGRQRGRGRAVRRGQPGRQAASVVPAPRRAGADLLQPRAHRAAVRRGLEVQLALSRHPEL